MPEKKDYPEHIAIIMDGNGRWARQRMLPRTAGHREGIKRVKDIVKACVELKVKFLTLFGFSTENWNRPKSEISLLMKYLDYYLDTEVEELHKNNIRFIVIGEGDPLPKKIQEKIKKSEEKTKENSAMSLILALNYGSRQEIIQAAKKFAKVAMRGELSLDDLDEERFESFLYTAGIPDPDLLIRTSSELRISNFLLWQLSYSELYFSQKYWPDFKKEDLKKAIEVYKKRERRFGKV